MAKIMMHISKMKLPFYPSCEVKCGFQNGVLTKDAKDGGQYNIPSGPKCFGYQGFGHIKQECPTYLKTIRKSKAFVASLSDTKPKIESDDIDDEGILSAFTATIDPTERVTEIVDDEEDLVISKFKKMDEQDDIHTAYAKLYEVFAKA